MGCCPTGTVCTGARCARRWSWRSRRRGRPQRIAPQLAPYKSVIDAMLRLDADAPKKQRHTARRYSGAVGRRARRDRPVVFHGARLMSASAARSNPGQAEQSAAGGVRAANPSTGGRRRRPTFMPGQAPARREDQYCVVQHADVDFVEQTAQQLFPILVGGGGRRPHACRGRHRVPGSLISLWGKGFRSRPLRGLRSSASASARVCRQCSTRSPGRGRPGGCPGRRRGSGAGL